MSTRHRGALEELLLKVLVPVCAASGLVVISGFFFPSFVGSVVTGQGWLVVALLFFGSGLCYLALLSGPEADTGSDLDATEPSIPYRRRFRRLFRGPTVRRFIARQDPVTFGVPVVVLALFFGSYLALGVAVQEAIGVVRHLLLVDLGIFFLGSMFLFVLFCLFLLLGPWGDVKLGGPDAEPTYTYPTYFAMFFTAGIAAGIVFWGPAEGVVHYGTVPPYVDAQPRTSGALLGGLTYAMFHWGFSAWTAYAVIGIPIAYYVYDRGAPLRVSTVLAPFLGVDGLDGAWAKLVDVLAVFATIGGIATSVALVSTQFLAAIEYQWGVEYGTVEPVLFVAGLTVIYVVAAASGVHRGIRRTAAVTLVLFLLFVGLVLGVGPRRAVLGSGATAFGRYLAEFVPMSLYAGGEWVADWTVWNWSWWFSWAPFAGLFLAATSKGRRIRTVVLTGVVATSAATLAWFVVVGGTALHLQHAGVADVLGAVNSFGGEAVAGFPVFEALPVSRLLNFLFLALIVVFIVTSAAVSTLVVAILATGNRRPPTNGGLVFWGAFQGAVAVAVLLIGGGDTLQAAAVLTGGPFAVISLVAVAGLVKTLRDHEGERRSVLGVVGDAVDGLRSR